MTSPSAESRDVVNLATPRAPPCVFKLGRNESTIVLNGDSGETESQNYRGRPVTASKLVKPDEQAEARDR
jgi:hypothetical protein